MNFTKSFASLVEKGWAIALLGTRRGAEVVVWSWDCVILVLFYHWS
jgi:hypothetical protein